MCYYISREIFVKVPEFIFFHIKSIFSNGVLFLFANQFMQGRKSTLDSWFSVSWTWPGQWIKSTLDSWQREYMLSWLFSCGFAYREDACKDAEGADHLERQDATVWCFYAFWFACNCVCTSWEQVTSRSVGVLIEGMKSHDNMYALTGCALMPLVYYKSWISNDV